MLIRSYSPDDAAATLEVFVRSIHALAAGDYSPAQLTAWSRGDRPLDDAWRARRAEAGTLVAEVDGRVVGFTDLLPDGYIDMLFVHPDEARTGVATALLRTIIAQGAARGFAELTANASITSRPVFELMGFVVESEQQVGPSGEQLTNYRMRRTRVDAAALDTADPLAPARDRFLPAEGVTAYLDGNSLGRPLAASRERMIQFIDEQWATRLIRGWDESWLELPLRIGDDLARVALGASAGQTVIGDSTTVLLYKLMRAAVDARPGRTELVVSRDDFPTDRYVVEGIAAERGLELRWIDAARGVTADDVHAAVSERTAAVVLSHVAYRSGHLVDAAAVTDAVHAVGGLILWDLSHSAGVVPVELDAWGADLAVGCGYKYLNGGPGAPAFAYVRKDLQGELRQPIQGWLGSRAPFEMGQGYEPAEASAAFSAARRRSSGCSPCRTPSPCLTSSDSLPYARSRPR